MTNRPLALGLVLLCTSALAAQDAPPKAPAAREEVPGWCARLSPKGERVLWTQRVEREDGSKAFAYYVRELGSKEPGRKVLDVDVSSDDYLEYLNAGGARQWAPDGQRFAFATRNANGQFRCGIANLAGETKLFEGEQDTRSLCFAPEGGGGWFVEGSLKGRPMGFRIRAFNSAGEAGKAVFEAKDQVVLGLEPSPLGTHLAFLFGDKERGLRIGVLTLADGTLVESGPVRTDDHFLKPRPLWTPDGASLVLTTRGPEGKWPANVVRCDAKTGELKTLIEAGQWAVTGILSDGQVCLYDRDDEKVALLNPRDGLLREVEWPVIILQQEGQRSLLFKLEPRGMWVN